MKEFKIIESEIEEIYDCLRILSNIMGSHKQEKPIDRQVIRCKKYCADILSEIVNKKPDTK